MGPEDRFATELRGFGVPGILAIVLILLTGNIGAVPVGAILVLAWAALSRTPWTDLGFTPPRSWPRTVLIGVAFGSAFKLCMKSVVMPLLGADPINHAYHFLVGNEAALPAAIWVMVVNAGFGEELLFRGFAFERLGKLLGHGPGARLFTVLFTAVWFGAEHYHDQGVPGVQQATITGLIFGVVYAITGRIWVPMVAHASFDLTALAIIYWNLEEKVAHWFFR